MLTLIAMFFLGFLFSSCCWSCIWLSSMDRKEDEHLQEMEKWYRDAYGEDDDQWLSSMDRKEDEYLQEMEKWYIDAYGEDADQ